MPSALDHATSDRTPDSTSNRPSFPCLKELNTDSRSLSAQPYDPRSTSASVTSLAALAGRALGALALLVMGAVHLHEYFGPYSAIPTIGPLFVLNFAGATVIGLLLLAPLEHLAGRWAGIAVAVLTVSGIALAASSLVLLTISERTQLFGFHEPGYDPAGIALSKQVEIAAVVLLGTSVVARFATKRSTRRW
jgi:hypothetical protein